MGIRMNLFNKLQDIPPKFITQQQVHDYRKWLKENENDDCTYWCKIRELDEMIVVPVDLEPKPKTIWEII